MNRNTYVFCCFVLTLAGLGGCSSKPPANEAKKLAVAREKIQGKAQVLLTETTATDVALSAGGPAVYLWADGRRYRLFMRTPYQMEGGQQYTVEGYNAQKIIDDIGDPDQGKNGYPLLSSCRRVVKMAWPNMALDVTDGHSQVLRDRINRYPARTVFVVTRIQSVTEKEGGATAAKKAAQPQAKEAPEVEVAPEKQKALLVEGKTVYPAPLWAPQGGTTSCKVLIGTDGKIADLETGKQLCESVPWSQFRYQPTLQRGKPVKVRTDVEVRFEPRTIS